MRAKKLDGVEVWKQLQDDLAPRLKLNVVDRTVYAHLLRHTRLEGKVRRRFTIASVALQIGISRGPVRKAMRRLAGHGVLRLVDRSYGGYLVEVRLPCEVRAAKSMTGGSRRTNPPGEVNLEQINFLNTTKLRQAMHARGWPVLLLPAAGSRPGALPGPRGAECQVRAELVPEPSLVLSSMQLAKEG